MSTPPPTPYDQPARLFAALADPTRLAIVERLLVRETLTAGEIAEAKMKDLNANDVDAAMRMVEGSARSMGLEVVG